MVLQFLFVILYCSVIFVAFLMIAKTLGSVQNLLARLENLLAQEMELLLKKETIRRVLFEAQEEEDKKKADDEAEAAEAPIQTPPR
jgi:predicted Holliday junction resolvase-like endonuclease